MKYEINNSKYFGIELEPANPEFIKMEERYDANSINR